MKRTKHLEVDCHLIQHHYKAGFVQHSGVSSSSQLTDMFTKSAPHWQLALHCSKMNVISSCRGTFKITTSNADIKFELDNG